MTEQQRDRATGRYVDTDFDKLCWCHHRLGDHTAYAVNGQRECLKDGCACERFRPTRHRLCAHHRLTPSRLPQS